MKIERRKAQEVEELVKSGGATAAVKKSSSKVNWEKVKKKKLFYPRKCMMFWFNLKIRNEQIQFANNALSIGDITPRQFLDQIVYRGNNICDNVLPSQNLAPAEDYFDIFLDDEMTNEPAPTVNQNAENLCEVCYVRRRDTAFIPCAHVFCCWECSERWKRTDVSSFDLHALLNDDEDEEALVNTEPLQNIRCPICRGDVKSTIQLKFT